MRKEYTLHAQIVLRGPHFPTDPTPISADFCTHMVPIYDGTGPPGLISNEKAFLEAARKKRVSY